MYQYYCNDCEQYGHSQQDLDTARRDGDAHQMETGHTRLEIHLATSGGGYEVVEAFPG